MEHPCTRPGFEPLTSCTVAKRAIATAFSIAIRNIFFHSAHHLTEIGQGQDVATLRMADIEESPLTLVYTWWTSLTSHAYTVAFPSHILAFITNYLAGGGGGIAYP
jgi:hypothetical protein